MYRLDWNKQHTKLKIYTTISDGYVTGWEKPEDLLKDPKYGDLIKERVYKICSRCNRKFEEEEK